ncbi:MAG: SGNH/GDSL hydrolase family protein, partial [Sciscionella sp.]
PALWDAATAPASFSFMACSGANTSDVRSGQVSALHADTTLVSITVGGNDAGFSSVITACVERGTSGCKTATDNAIDYVLSTLGASLDSTYSAIRSAAPAAKVLVLGYPHLYAVPGDCVVGLSDTSRGYLNHAADVLDGTIATHAQSAGFHFVDVRSQFSGHEICTPDRWLNSLTYPVESSYHPNKAGQAKGYYPRMSSAAASSVAARS